MYSKTMNNTCDNANMNHISDPCNVDYYSTGPYDNGHLVYKVDEPSDDELDAKPQLQLETPCVSLDVVYNGLPSNESIDSQYKSRSPKRAASEINGTEHESGLPKPAKASRKARKSKAKSSGAKATSVQKPRVGCPFFKQDPRGHAQTMSCRGIGWDEIGKLKYVPLHRLTHCAQDAFLSTCLLCRPNPRRYSY
jgi:hypothetical protein